MAWQECLVIDVTFCKEQNLVNIASWTAKLEEQLRLSKLVLEYLSGIQPYSM